MITVLVDIRLSMSMVIAIARFGRSLMVTSIPISLNTLRTSVVIAYSGAVTISRLSRSLAIITFSKSLGGSVDIAVSAISIAWFSISRSLLIIMLNLISVRSMIMITVLMDIRLSMSMVVTITWLSRSFAIISFSKSLSSPVDMTVPSISITRLT